VAAGESERSRSLTRARRLLIPDGDGPRSSDARAAVRGDLQLLAVTDRKIREMPGGWARLDPHPSLASRYGGLRTDLPYEAVGESAGAPLVADDKRLVPAFELLVDGQKAGPDLASAILGIRCSDDMDRAARFQLHISDVGRKWTKSDKFKPGTAVEIKLGYVGEAEDGLQGRGADAGSGAHPARSDAPGGRRVRQRAGLHQRDPDRFVGSCRHSQPMPGAGDSRSGDLHSVSFGAGICSPFAAPVLQAFLTVREVAARLSVSTATVYKLCTTHQLPCVRVLGAIRIAPADVAAYIRRARDLTV